MTPAAPARPNGDPAATDESHGDRGRKADEDSGGGGERASKTEQLNRLVREVLQTSLVVELADHPGNEPYDPAGVEAATTARDEFFEK